MGNKEITDEEYHLILLKLGLLTDDDNWDLFKLQEKPFDDVLYSVNLLNYSKNLQNKIIKIIKFKL